MMKRLFYILLVVLFLSCGQSVEERKRLSLAEKREQRRQDSLAFKVAVMPTLDCLPFFLAKEKGWFDSLDVDVRLRVFNAQMDCDTAFAGKSVEAMVSDVVRTERMKEKGVALSHLTFTNACWQLFTSRKSRLKKVSQLGDKMIAMTRFSATDLLCDKVLEGVKTSSIVFRIQVNDVNVRCSMLQNSEIDAAWLTEPYATAARGFGAQQMADSRKINSRLGVVAVRDDATMDKRRRQQLEAMTKAYDKACDSLNVYGVKHYAEVIRKYCRVDTKTINTIPKQQYIKVGSKITFCKAIVVGADAFLLPYRGGRERLGEVGRGLDAPSQERNYRLQKKIIFEHGMQNKFAQ